MTMTAFEREEIEAAQQAWGDGLIAIGQVYLDKGDYTERAKEHITALYGYHLGPVIFKPTLAANKQFRDTAEGALS